MIFFCESYYFVKQKLCRKKKYKLRGEWQFFKCGRNHVGKEAKMPNLESFTGNPRVKQIPSDWTKVSEILELFFGDIFFEMLSKETNLYYFQNQAKYDSSSKELKWVDVSVVCATHKKRSETRYICKFCLVLLHKGECFQRYCTLKHY
jgi:hypothetical protein